MINQKEWWEAAAKVYPHFYPKQFTGLFMQGTEIVSPCSDHPLLETTYYKALAILGPERAHKLKNWSEDQKQWTPIKDTNGNLP